jgi:hypothetical protein
VGWSLTRCDSGRSEELVASDHGFLSGRRANCEFCSALVLALLAALALAQPIWAQAEDAFPVEGQVVNGTAGGSPPIDARVRAYAYSRERVDGPWEGEVDDSGFYRVERVPRIEGAIYVLGIDFADTSYAERVEQPGDGAVARKDVTVYDSSPVDPGVQFEQTAILVSTVDANQRVISVAEIHRLDNPTDRTFAPSAGGPGGPAGLVVFPLPPNAFDLRVDAGLDPSRLVQIDRGFASLAPVPPGRTEIGFSYKFPYTDEEVQIGRTVRYPVARFSILVPQDGPAIASDRLVAGEPATIGGRAYRTLTGGPVASGQSIQITLRDLPFAGGPMARIPPAAAAVAGVLIGVGALVSASLRRRPALGPASMSDEDVVEELVELERQRAEARISLAEYQQARDRIVEGLRPVNVDRWAEGSALEA